MKTSINNAATKVALAFFWGDTVCCRQYSTGHQYWGRRANFHKLNFHWISEFISQILFAVVCLQHHTIERNVDFCQHASETVSRIVKLVNQKIKWLMRVLRNQKINAIQPNSHSPLQSKSIFLPVMFTKHDRGFALGNEFIYIFFPGSYFTGYETRCSIMEFRGAAGKQNAHRFDQIVPFLLCIPVNYHDGQTNVATKWRIDVHSN